MARALALVAVVLAALAALAWSRRGGAPPKVSGFVEADEIRLGWRVGGRVKAVTASEGAAVKAGDTLVELDPFDLTERRAQAAAEARRRREEAVHVLLGARPEEIEAGEARRDEVAARLARLVAGPRKQEVDSAAAQVTQAEARLELARRTHERTKALLGKGSSSEEELDRAAEALAAAEAALRVRRLDLDVLREGSRKEDIDATTAALREATSALELLKKGSRAEDVAAAKAAADAADAGLAAIDRQMEELRIRAPIDGVVEALELRPGDLVAPNAPVLSLADPSRLWVRAYLPEDRLDVRTGSTLDVTVDAFPSRRFKAHVAFVARQAEFTPGNVQTPEQRARQVFRVKVELDEGVDVLRPGMSADVWLPGR